MYGDNCFCSIFNYVEAVYIWSNVSTYKSGLDL